MKKSIAAVALIASLIVPAVSMAAGGDYQSYTNTYPVSQSSSHQVNTAK
ncbi:hypothetical protein [Biostraticola tofi]|uniref:Uncharacterized protein n=1 Tax=Biostraticola tofi TaxID=466109 RepID=A0A4R3Z7P7_9GAMM|nr:hypothetical protein [Biostraticola tofi]TCW00080.1 hypothetical protein EDC52_101424 [Biostraticola tofi]